MESVEDDAQTNQSTQSRSTKSHSKVVIKELAEVTTKEDIKRTFASAGTVTHVFFPKEWLGFAIVTFSSPSGGRKATELLDQSKLGGSKIRVLLYNKAKKSQTKSSILLPSHLEIVRRVDQPDQLQEGWQKVEREETPPPLQFNLQTNVERP